MKAYARLHDFPRGQPLDTRRPSSGAHRGAPGSRLAEWAAEWCAAWGQTCADYCRAAALYEGLRRLSDAELNRRRLSRATLARDIAQACDRSNGGPLL
ncbi:MAG TPA: hypothetical protein VGF29_12595 [Hyphomicrobiaceae bacterium]